MNVIVVGRLPPGPGTGTPTLILLKMIVKKIWSENYGRGTGSKARSAAPARRPQTLAGFSGDLQVYLNPAAFCMM